jgi:tRNA(fMet)-specific endonuclease VapC
MRYLLDTNICIYIAKQKPLEVLARFRRLRYGDVGMSVITHLELVYGAWKSHYREANLQSLQSLERLIPVLPLDANVSHHYGQLRAELESKGAPIGAYDLLIAAHALALGLTLVTNNVREFRRVPQLSIENWAEGESAGGRK